MCQAAVSVISKALHEVDNAESILKIKNLLALFMQTMNVRWFKYPIERSQELIGNADVELPGEGF